MATTVGEPEIVRAILDFFPQVQPVDSIVSRGRFLLFSKFHFNRPLFDDSVISSSAKSLAQTANLLVKMFSSQAWPFLREISHS